MDGRKPGFSHAKVVVAVAAMAAMAAMVVACGPEDMRIPLEEIEPSAGGTIPTMKTVEFDGRPHLVAPVGDRLYVRPDGEDSWRGYQARWPVEIEEPGLKIFETLYRAGRDRQVGPEHYFRAVDGELWTVAMPGAGQRPRLLHSDDLGRSWREVELPDESRPAADRARARATLTPSLRLAVTDDRLVITDGRHLWGAGDVGETEEGRVEVAWQPVSLEGTRLIDADESAGQDRRAFPYHLHHYLQVDDEDDRYELLTVYGRQLQIYRRDDDEESFEHVSTLDGVDRDLIRDSERDTLFVVQPEGVYRSDDRGEDWQRLEVSRDSLDPEHLRRLYLREDETDEEASRLWLLGDGGGLWRSFETDDGDQDFEQLRDRDTDGRALTALVFDDERNRVWAGSEGPGVLRSDDGIQWREANEGLRAAEVRGAALRGSDRLLVGTDGGLFEQTIVGGSGDGSRLDDRATTALHVDDGDDRIVAGTAGGQIELYVGGDKRESSEVTPVDQADDLEFRPPRLEGARLEPAMIVEVVDRPDSPELVAWSHRRGPMISNDDGETWRHLQLGEAFENAVSNSVITQFLALREQAYFAVTRPRRPNQPTRLWRSDDGGSTWQTTYTLRDDIDETPMRLVGLPDDQGLLMAHGSRVAVSTDWGQSWSTVAGPWDSGVVTGLAVDGSRIAVIMNLPHASEIAWLEDPAGSADVDQRHRLGWPPNRMFGDHRPLGAQVRGERILIQDRHGTYRGQTPRRTAGSPGSVSLVVAFGAVIALVTLAFGYLRRWETTG